MNELLILSFVVATILVVWLCRRIPGRNRISDFFVAAIITMLSVATGFLPGIAGGMAGWVGTLMVDMPVSEEDNDATLLAFVEAQQQDYHNDGAVDDIDPFHCMEPSMDITNITGIPD